MLQKIAHILMPPGTLRAQLPGLTKEAMRVWREEGAGEMLLRTRKTLQAQWRGFKIVYGLGKQPYSYKSWIKDNEPSQAEIAQQRTLANQFPYYPQFDIVTPVYNPPIDVLREAIESVRAQSYPHWTLYLVNGASDRPGVRETLDEYAELDERVCVIHLAHNGGISTNSNAALAQAEGDYIALLDHDDLLAPHMLFEVAQRLNDEHTQQPDAPPLDVVYFDEDKISADSKERMHPWFKPQFAPDTLLGGNILMHCVIRRQLLQEIGGFDPKMDGAQDWDVALRLSEVTKRMAHIPKVLYHWRRIEGSAALDADAKPWAYEAQKRAIAHHLARIGTAGAEITFPAKGVLRILWPQPTAKISIIIPTKNKAELIRACLTSIFEQSTYENYEVILVDTGSSESETLAYYESLRGEPRLKIVEYSGSFNYSRANNLGAQHATGELLLFLNNDTEVLEPDWLEEMAGWATRPGVGIVGAKLIRPDHTLQHAGIIMGMGGHCSHVFDGGRERDFTIFGSPEMYHNYQAVTGACMMVRRDLFEKLCGLDELYVIGFNDVDLCLRAQEAGYRVVYTPFARLLHHEGGSRGFFMPFGDILRGTLRMWPIIRQGDPYYNPNISYTKTQPSIPEPKEADAEERLLTVLEHFGLMPWRTPLNRLEDIGLGRNGAALPVPAAWADYLETKAARNGQMPIVVLVAHNLSRSGAPLMLYMLARYLKTRGYPVRVVSAKAGPLQELFDEAAIQCRVFEKLHVDARVAAQAIGSDADLVVANTIVTWPAIHAATAFGAPSILWIHESEYGRNYAKRYPGAAAALATATCVLFPAQATANLYTEWVGDGRHTILPYGLDIELLAPPLLGPNGQAGAEKSTSISVVAIASVEPRKGQDTLLKAIEALPAEVQGRMNFAFIGGWRDDVDAGYVRALRKGAKRHSNIKITGELAHAQVNQRLAAADIFVLPSRDEVLPVTILEAMYHGKAIISTRVGGVAEIIEDGVNGLLVDVEDHKALAEKLALLTGDVEQCNRLGAAARKTFNDRLTMEQFGPAFEQIMTLVSTQ